MCRREEARQAPGLDPNHVKWRDASAASAGPAGAVRPPAISIPITGYFPLVDEELGGVQKASASTAEPELQPAARDESGGWLAEWMGAVLTTVLTTVLNVTYAGVIMGSTPALQPYMSHGIFMCLGCTALSNLWLLCARRNMPFITVADSFMAVLFASMANDIVIKGGEGVSVLGTLAVAMVVCSAVLAFGYVAVGVLRVGNLVQFVPSPVMAGYQASIGYLLLNSAATLSSGCSLLQPACLVRLQSLTQVIVAAALGVGLFAAQRHTTGVMRILILPAMLIGTTLAYQLALLLQPWHGLNLTDWSLQLAGTGRWRAEDSALPLPPAASGLASIVALPADLDAGSISWALAGQEALLTAVTAFVPNLLGKLLQFSALTDKFDCDVDYNRELRHAGFSQLVSLPAGMVPTVTYLGMVVAHGMGARSFLPPAMVLAQSHTYTVLKSRCARCGACR